MTTGVLEPQLQDVDRPHPKQVAQHSALRRFVPIVKPYRWHFLGSIVVSIIGTLTGLVIPLVTQHIIDGPIKAGHFADVWWPAVLVLVLGSIDAFAIWIRRYLISHPSSQFEISARAQIFAKLQHLSIASHDGWDSGQLLSRAIADLSSLRRFVAFIGPFLIINSVTIVAGIGVLLVLSWPLGVVVLVMSVPLVMVCIKFESLYQVVSRRAQDQGGDLTTTVEESIQGIRVLKAFGRSPFAAKGFLKQAAQLRVTELTKVRYLAVLWTVIVSVPSLGIGVALAFGTYSIVHGTMTIGTLVAAMSVVAFLLWPIEAFGFLLAELNNARTAADRYWEIMDTPETISDATETVPLPNPLRGTLTFDHVAFAFPDASRDQLHDINLEIQPGETVALVGVTGSGKTAMTNLVARLYDVTAGKIMLDGIDIRTLKLRDLRSVMAVAFEDPVLFSASVRENVALGHPSATMADIREALEVASAADFVEELPWGIDTRIGEQGMSLSGGQRQRLALARAVLGKPRILVLDDPLSALDVNTEAQVQEALRRILTQSTTLLVAHRPSTAALADRVAHLEDGRITEVGTHESLLATSARYRHVMGSVDE